MTTEGGGLLVFGRPVGPVLSRLMGYEDALEVVLPLGRVAALGVLTLKLMICWPPGSAAPVSVERNLRWRLM